MGAVIVIYGLAEFIIEKIMGGRESAISSLGTVLELALFVVPGFFGISGLIAFIYYLLKESLFIRHTYTMLLMVIGTLPLIFAFFSVDEIDWGFFLLFIMPLLCTAHLLVLLFKDMRVINNRANQSDT